MFMQRSLNNNGPINLGLFIIQCLRKSSIWQKLNFSNHPLIMQIFLKNIINKRVISENALGKMVGNFVI
ncbi:hypothetical protein BTHERMOSOX_452 [Bathymodiolus thermophilus thioautotrophic gill symbiont]|jgi:hypothetical protein|uniref:Uncharacterized protein n=2 Tax=Bathymodiolus thermophilus thioautotrophic gill symbiont TaxID=2360 RepID=A0A3G3IMG3_9GAMM|nr:hypothetical protein MS2017_1232 [Bathymodiolus thermophilus thioautotrophic gill symbiont]CAB5497750.1 hypothetical protein THERMOS_725 [Bathymodiolus thermophilus thioautotrophic gill symbiont]SGZ63429.1 hypothetical protein BTHERMOSOX_452 [Bathymodiolus thermophilus thioautotrophic gill symbiont]